MKTLFLILIGLSTATVSAKVETLYSKNLQKQICQSLAAEYSAEAQDDYDYLENYGVIVDQAQCEKSNATVLKKTTQDVGSKKYVVWMDIIFPEIKDIRCSLSVRRSVKVSLDKKDQPVVQVNDWSILDSTCMVSADPELVTLDFYEAEKLGKLTAISSSKLSVDLYIPEYLELGEPDDGTVGTYNNYYSYIKDGDVMGYVVEVIYANSEGEWATQYILKYNASGKLLGNLISSNGLDYCDYFSADYGYEVEDEDEIPASCKED